MNPRRYFRPIAATVTIVGLAAVTIAWPPGWSIAPLIGINVLLIVVGVVLLWHERRVRQATPRYLDWPLESTWELKPAPEDGSGELPTVSGKFQGRHRELRELLRHHAEAENPETTATGPVLQLIYGMPGVGKTALAQELAVRLAERYPDGQVYVNLGNAGNPLSPGEILSEFLAALHWPDQAPSPTTDRVKLFRAFTTGRRMLFVLDAAHDPSQVLNVLPSEPSCAVIVTSRRYLGPQLGARSWLLETPNLGDAMSMLRAASRLDEYAHPECAIEVVNLCGRLPLAIRSVGEQIAQGGWTVCTAAKQLRADTTRLERLAQPGRDIEDSLAIEYQQLTDLERRTLCLLTLVESETFGSWVLCALLPVGGSAAERLATRLTQAQLLDAVGVDELFGLARYRFHPLVRLFAVTRLNRDPDLAAQCHEARLRLDESYRQVVQWLLAEVDPDWDTSASPRIDLAALPRGIRGALPPLVGRTQARSWVHSEHRNLARCARRAYDARDWDLCWRLVSLLGASLPEGSPEQLTQLFGLGIKAAGKDRDPYGHIDVLLAKGSVLTALERYVEAGECLRQARSEAEELAGRGEPYRVAGVRRQAQAQLKLGEGYLQMRFPHRATEELASARELFAGIDDEEGLQLVRLLDALNLDRRPADLDRALDGAAPEAHRYWAHLAAAEDYRRARAWEEAETQLRYAAVGYSSDARRYASVQYRFARLYLEQAAAGGRPRAAAPGGANDSASTGGGRGGSAEITLAMQRAAQAMSTFEQMKDPIGEVRARCLLVRIMAAAGRVTEAEAQLTRAHTDFIRLNPRIAGPALRPLKARMLWADGALMLHRDRRDARDLLLRAARELGELGDHRSVRRIHDLLGG